MHSGPNLRGTSGAESSASPCDVHLDHAPLRRLLQSMCVACSPSTSPAHPSLPRVCASLCPNARHDNWQLHTRSQLPASVWRHPPVFCFWDKSNILHQLWEKQIPMMYTFGFYFCTELWDVLFLHLTTYQNEVLQKALNLNSKMLPYLAMMVSEAFSPYYINNQQAVGASDCHRWMECCFLRWSFQMVVSDQTFLSRRAEKLCLCVCYVYVVCIECVCIVCVYIRYVCIVYVYMHVCIICIVYVFMCACVL